MDTLGTMIEVVVEEVGVADKDCVALNVDVGVGRLVRLLDALKDMVEEGDGVAVMEMVYDPDGVRLEDLEALLEEEGLRLEVREDDGDRVQVLVIDPEREGDRDEDGVAEGVSDDEAVYVTVEVNEEVVEGDEEVVDVDDAV